MYCRRCRRQLNRFPRSSHNCWHRCHSWPSQSVDQCNCRYRIENLQSGSRCRFRPNMPGHPCTRCRSRHSWLCQCRPRSHIGPRTTSIQQDRRKFRRCRFGLQRKHDHKCRNCWNQSSCSCKPRSRMFACCRHRCRRCQRKTVPLGRSWCNYRSAAGHWWCPRNLIRKLYLRRCFHTHHPSKFVSPCRHDHNCHNCSHHFEN